MNFNQEIVQALKFQKLVVFCGAGISLHSGLPLSNQFINYMLNKLEASESNKKVYLDSNLPFEAFIETLLGDSGNNLNILDAFNTENKPNTNHILIAKLAKIGYLKLICTTNFDKLLERAFENEGLKEGKDFHVFHNENDFKKLKLNSSIINLIKLHGSIDDKENMAVTLKKVSNESISKTIKSIINFIFSTGAHDSVLILGYSCSDLFDISPIIESINNSYKKVFFIEHSLDSNYTELITNKELNNPFKKFLHGSRIITNTDKFIENIWQNTITEDYVIGKVISNKLAWKIVVDKWLGDISDSFSGSVKFSILGKLFYKISSFQNSIKYFEKALKSIHNEQENTTERQKLEIEQTFRSMFKNLPLFDEFLESDKFKETQKKISPSKYDKILQKQEAINLNHIAIINSSLGNHQIAVEKTKKSLEKIDNLLKDNEKDNIDIKATLLGNLGSYYSNLKDSDNSIYYSNEALKLFKNHGDKEGECRTYNNLGTCFEQMIEHNKAIEMYNKSIRLAKELGNIDGEAYSYHNIGNVYQRMEEKKSSIKYYKKALKIFKNIGNKNGEATTLGSLGLCYGLMDDLKKQEEYIIEAIEKSKETGNVENISSNFRKLGLIYIEEKNYKQGLRYYNEALKLLNPLLGKDHPDIKRIEEIIKNLNIIIKS
jgi:tetratricopeptide (TPR) repeat protein